MNTTNYFNEKRTLIELMLNKLFSLKNVSYNSLYEAARYAILGSGKRLRPLLVLTTAESFGKSIEESIISACALEMIHTYSLIHDDLPCMDDDDFRRNKPSLHKAFDEGLAVLTGDFLLTYAFETIATDTCLKPDQQISIIALLAKHAGGGGMIGGQVMDIESENKQVDLDFLKQIHRHKTGALITASIEIGGVIGCATPFEMQILQNFGNNIGLAFQIIDDIIDVTESEKKHGKAISSDIRNNKATYVTLLGLSEAENAAKTHLETALEELSKARFNTDLLQQIAKCLVFRDL